MRCLISYCPIPGMCAFCVSIPATESFDLTSFPTVSMIFSMVGGYGVYFVVDNPDGACGRSLDGGSSYCLRPNIIT